MLPPLDTIFTMRNSISSSATPTVSMATPTSKPPKKKGGFTIDSLIDTTEDVTDNEPDNEILVKPSPLQLPLPPPTSMGPVWPPFYNAAATPPLPPYPPILPNFHLHAAANLHMAAMAALAAQQQQQQQQNNLETSRPFLEVPREGASTAFSQQMSPTARSDISSCSSGSSFNSIHGDLFPVNLSNAATSIIK